MMKKAITMPALTDTMESARLLRWVKQAGDPVEQGEALAEIETDKAVAEMEAFESGYLAGPLAVEDREYAVGEPLAWLVDEPPTAAREGEEAPDRAGVEPRKQAETAKAEVRVSAVPAERPTGQSARGSIVPSPRAAANGAEENAAPVVAQALAGRIPAGRRESAGAKEEDAVAHALDAGPPFTVRDETRLRQLVADSVTRAVHAPQFRITTSADLSPLGRYAHEGKWSFSLLLARACALSLREHPRLNAAWTRGGLAERARVDIAIAMEVEQGLLTPVLRDVAGRSLPELADDWRALKQGIEAHRMSPADYRGATFYLSNLGTFGAVDCFDAIVPPGAAAILAVAAPRPQGTALTLSCDHRVVFGADAARFLATLRERLRNPSSLKAGE